MKRLIAGETALNAGGEWRKVLRAAPNAALELTDYGLVAYKWDRPETSIWLLPLGEAVLRDAQQEGEVELKAELEEPSR